MKELATKIVDAINKTENDYDAREVVEFVLQQDELSKIIKEKTNEEVQSI